MVKTRKRKAPIQGKIGAKQEKTSSTSRGYTFFSCSVNSPGSRRLDSKLYKPSHAGPDRTGRVRNVGNPGYAPMFDSAEKPCAPVA